MTAIVNAGLEAAVSLVGPNVEGELTVAVSGNRMTLTLQFDEPGIYRFPAWLSDGTDARPSLDTPDTSGARTWDIITDSSGLATVIIEHTGTKTWYFCWSMGGWVNVSDALEFA